MNVFWSAERSLSKSDIVNLSPQRSWKETSVHILLNSLISKGAITVDGFTTTKTNIGRTFRPCFTQEEYVASILKAGGHPVKVNAARLFSAFHDIGAIDEDTIVELEEIIKSLREEKSE